MFILNIQILKTGLLIKVFFSLYVFKIVFSDTYVGFQRTWVVLGSGAQYLDRRTIGNCA